MKLLSFFLLLTSMTVLFVQCQHDPTVDPTPIDTGDCDPDSVYFYDQVLPIFVSNCAQSGCHDDKSAEEDVILTSFHSVVSTGEVRAGRPENSKVYEVLNESGEKRMPPSPATPLTAEQKEMIYNWIEQGARNLTCDNSANCDSLDVSFRLDVAPILQTHCQGCHGNTNPSGGIKLTTYANVTPYATNGKLLGAITHSAGFQMMPPAGGKIAACKIATIRAWINEGAREN